MRNDDHRMWRAALAATLVLTLPACATVDQRPIAGAVAEQPGVIPFTSASVSADGTISWSAPGAGRVTLYAGTDSAVSDRTKAVGQGDATGSIRVSGLAPGKRWFFALVPDRGAPLVIADRGLHLKTIPNLRDVGGYRTTDGRWVKMGMIYRSDQLDRLSDSDLGAMGDLGLALVADLRTASERSHEPDRLPAGAEHLLLDVVADSKGSVGGDMRQAMATIAAGKGAEMLTEANRDFVSLDSARSAYHTLLTRIGAEGAGPTLYHCTSGKDRTGWASAVILTILGVPRETVMADYLASNDYLRAKNDATIAMLGKLPTPIARENLEPVLTVRAAYIEAAFAEVDKRYGSFDRYVREGLGLDDAAIDRLRTTLLAGVPQ
jgi:protein-tyrosine phosphatase